MLPEKLSKRDKERVERTVSKWMAHEQKFIDDPAARARDSQQRVRTRAAVDVVTDWARQWLAVKGVPDAVHPMYTTLAWLLYKVANQDRPHESKAARAASLLHAWAAQKMDPAVLTAMCREVLGFAPGDELPTS